MRNPGIKLKPPFDLAYDSVMTIGQTLAEHGKAESSSSRSHRQTESLARGRLHESSEARKGTDRVTPGICAKHDTFALHEQGLRRNCPGPLCYRRSSALVDRASL